MELKIVLFGGVIPACILGIVLVASGFLPAWWRRGSTRHNIRDTDEAGETPASSGVRDRQTPEVAVSEGGTSDSAVSRGGTPVKSSAAAGSVVQATRLATPALFWILGAALALPFIQYANWSFPTLWHKDATYRMLQSASLLLIWSLAEPFLPRRAPFLRPAGRFIALSLVLGVLLHAYLGVLGWTTVILGSLIAAALAVASAAASTRAAERHHLWIVMTTMFLASVGAVAVLILGRTATAAQASAGIAALFAATALASLIVRRSTPAAPPAFVLTALLTWLLAVGCFGTGQTNLASSILLLAAPVGLALPIPKFDLIWKRISPALVLGIAWALVCVGAAVAIAVLTQAPSPADSYAY